MLFNRRCVRRNVLQFSVAVVFAAIAGSDQAAAGEFVLVRDGQPAACIVVAKEPTRAASFAARELQYHLKKITDAELPIITDQTPTNAVCIFVGDSKATLAKGLKSTDFQSQEYLIRFQSNLSSG